MIYSIKILFMTFLFGASALAEDINNADVVTAVNASPINISSIFQVIAALLVIIILIVSLSWFFRKYGNTFSMNNANMKVISALSLGGKEKAVLIQVGEEQILIGVSPGSIRKIHVLNNNIIETEALADSFIVKLNKELRKVISK